MHVSLVWAPMTLTGQRTLKYFYVSFFSTVCVLRKDFKVNSELIDVRQNCDDLSIFSVDFISFSISVSLTC